MKPLEAGAKIWLSYGACIQVFKGPSRARHEWFGSSSASLPFLSFPSLLDHPLQWSLSLWSACLLGVWAAPQQPPLPILFTSPYIHRSLTAQAKWRTECQSLLLEGTSSFREEAACSKEEEKPLHYPLGQIMVLATLPVSPHLSLWERVAVFVGVAGLILPLLRFWGRWQSPLI